LVEGYKKVDGLETLITALKNDYYNACIIEPVQLDINTRNLLRNLRQVCIEEGTILIFDEVITGWRVPKYTVSNWFDIQPDLICLGKAIGAGNPLAVVGGRADIMETPDYFVSSTFGGEVNSLISASALLERLTEERLDRFWDLGGWFIDSFNKIGKEANVQIFGYNTRGELRGENSYLFMQEMIKKGYLFGKAFFLSLMHTRPMLEKCLADASETISDIIVGKVKFEGPKPKPIFKRNE